MEDLKATYAQAASLARRAETIEQEAEIWQNMVKYAEGAMNDLGLHNLALEYRDAANERLSLVNEALKHGRRISLPRRGIA